LKYRITAPATIYHCILQQAITFSPGLDVTAAIPTR